MNLPPQPGLPPGRATPPCPASATSDANTAGVKSGNSSPRMTSADVRADSTTADGRQEKRCVTNDDGGRVDGFRVEEAPKPKSKWKKCWDYAHAATYYKHVITKESRWASLEDPEWMEATDPSSGEVFLENVVSGETKWKTERLRAAGGEGNGGGKMPTATMPGRRSDAAAIGDAGGAAPQTSKAVWEELEEAGTGRRYYFSSASHTSQWYPPVWMDYMDMKEKCVYYFNTRTKESRWDRPKDFVAIAADNNPPGVRAFLQQGFCETRAGGAQPRSPTAPRLPKPPPGLRNWGSDIPGGDNAVGQRACSASSGGTMPSSTTTTGTPQRPISPAPRKANSPERNTAPRKSPGPPVARLSPSPTPSPEQTPTSRDEAAPCPPLPSVSSEEGSLPPPPPNRARGSKTSDDTDSRSGGGGADASSPTTHSVTGLPSPPPKLSDAPPSGRWSPRGSVPPPPGPPPVASLPPAQELTSVYDSDEDGDDDDDDTDLEAGGATG
ncbi:unnamed protein product [Scytosiphon promiscuus]